MTDPRHGHGWGGPPPWVGPGGFGPGPGRRFRRGALAVLLFLVLLVAALASVVAAIAGGNPPAPGITVAVATLVVLGLIASARWLWRSTRSVGALMDAADRVAGGDYATRVGPVPARQLGRLASAFDQMTERLETNEQRRRELLADIAHELRTPLQAIRGTVEGVVDGLYPPDEERLRQVIDRTELMSRLLDDLRTLSMAEAGVLTLHREPVSSRAVAEDSTRAFSEAAEEAGVSLGLDIAPDTPATIDADPIRLSEVLSNLLTNAIRYTPKGGHVTVRVSRAGSQGIAFEVEDTGPGIPADRLPTIFDRFVTSSDAGGTGLGLAIAKRLVEAHGGTITASIAPSGGTLMRVELPPRMR